MDGTIEGGRAVRFCAYRLVDQVVKEQSLLVNRDWGFANIGGGGRGVFI